MTSAARSHPPATSFDVAVIGGGIVGVASAAHLAEDGHRVVLLEREAIGAAASGRNSGVVQRPFDPAFTDLHLESVRRYRALGDLVDGFRLPDAPAGLLLVSLDPAAAATLADRFAGTHPDLDPVFVAPDDVRRLEPALGPQVAAVRLSIGYPVEPAAATRAYAAWAARLGVDLRIGSAARPWTELGRARGVEIATGERLAARDVVVAAGPWSPELLDPGGTWRPIRSIWGVVVAATLESPPRHVLEEADISIQPGDDAVAAGVEFSLMTAAGASSIGSTFLDAEPDPGAYVPEIVERATRFVPGVATARLGAHRRCARPVSLDGRPLVGSVPGVERLWIAAGHGPWGISTGPATGRLVADLIGGRLPAPPADIDPARFGAPPGAGPSA